MLVRLWETRFDRVRKTELVAYANDVSLPVLRTRPGCVGVLFFSHDDTWMTQTIWRDRASINALDRDTEYAQIVAGILALSILGPEQATTVYEMIGGSAQIG